MCIHAGFKGNDTKEKKKIVKFGGFEKRIYLDKRHLPIYQPKSKHNIETEREKERTNCLPVGDTVSSGRKFMSALKPGIPKA